MRRSALLAACAAAAMFTTACNRDTVLATEPRPVSLATSWGPETPNFNLEVILRSPNDGNGFGHVRFRQPNDDQTVVYLDPWVRDLAPLSDYFLQRAADGPADGVCSSTKWLTLGFGPVPAPITTDERGTGRAELFRTLTSPVGSQFDIQFRVVDAAGSVVLSSACYEFTASQ